MCFGDRIPIFGIDIICYAIAIGSLILSTGLTVTSLTYLILEGNQYNGTESATRHTFQMLLEDYFDVKVAHIIAGVTMFMGFLWVVFSILLLRGFKKNNPNLVMSYFLFGIVLTIHGFLCALLVLLNPQPYWKLSLVTFLGTLFYIQCLMVLYSAHDAMQKGRFFGKNQHGLLQEDLDEAFDTSTDEPNESSTIAVVTVPINY